MVSYERAGGLFLLKMSVLTSALLICFGDAIAAPTHTLAFPVDTATMSQIAPRSGARLSPAQLIERGRKIFATETFGGNGRTCATCHPASNNFTLDPRYIATLRRSDPLFVAETNPSLRGLENPYLLRRYALVTENVDGMDVPGVLRSVPHVLGLGLSVTPSPHFPLVDMTGWSGDGAPDHGSLREFAVGAVSQHLTKTLARVPGRDFRVPTDDELDALLAYQLSLGQQELLEVELGAPGELHFRDPAAEDGKLLFHTAPARGKPGSTNSCFGCHYQAGANDEALDDGGHGNNFATGVNKLPNSPACLVPGGEFGDGGFGKDPITTVAASTVCGHRSTAQIISRGEETFNVPSLVAAAETPPFFHNNSVATLEEAIAFYTTDTFNNSPAGAGHAFLLDATSIQHIAAFLRTVNAIENIVEATRQIGQGSGYADDRQALLQVDDAIKVLTEHEPAPLFAATHATDALRDARAKLITGNPALLSPAKIDLERARSLMVK